MAGKWIVRVNIACDLSGNLTIYHLTNSYHIIFKWSYFTNQEQLEMKGEASIEERI